MDVKNSIMGARVLLGMLAVQLVATGLQILSRVILSEGTFIFALMTYRQVVAAVCVAPLALCFERGVIKKLSFATFFWLFMVALFGICMAMGLFYYGLKDTTATYATNFLNLIPVVTFLFSTILRIEKLRLNTKAGKIRTLGAMLCLAGALTITLYKGKSFHLSHYGTHDHRIIDITNQNWTRGTFFLVGSCLSYGMWFILQVKLYKVFPHKYSGTFLTCIIGSVQATIIGLCIDRSPKAWKLGWNLQLVTIFYSGILATAATFILISWAIVQRGPTYPSMFNPLALILIAIIEALFLGEAISVGSLIGMGLIIVGLYSFLWGKHKDMKKTTPLPVKDSGDHHGGNSAGEIPESVGLQPSATIQVPAAN